MRTKDQIQGLSASLVSSIGFGTLDALTKLLLETVDTGWAIVLRSVLIGSMVAVVFIAWKGWGVMHTRAWAATALRSVLFAATGLLVVVSFKYMSLPEAIALYFMSPIVTIFVGALLLGERITARALFAAVLGFVGVILIVRPTSGTFIAAYALPLVAAVTGSIQDVMGRRLRDIAHPSALVVYGMMALVILTVIAVPIAPSQALSTREWALLVGSALAGVFAYLFVVISFQKLPARVVAPLRYLNLVWAVLFGYLIWHHVPDGFAAIGIVLIVSAGILAVWVPRR
jgi:drug/metabolite transporter (DMT)-like permease